MTSLAKHANDQSGKDAASELSFFENRQKAKREAVWYRRSVLWQAAQTGCFPFLANWLCAGWVARAAEDRLG
jgi:hypothetical protein